MLHLKFPLWLPLALSENTKSFLIPPGFASACPHPSHPTLGVVASYLHPCSLVSIVFFSGVIPLGLRMSSLFFGHVACGILVPQPGIQPTLHALEALSLYHWMAREVPCVLFVDFSRHTQTTWSHLQPRTQFHTSKAAEQHYG